MSVRIASGSLRLLGSAVDLPGRPVSTHDLLQKIEQNFCIKIGRKAAKVADLMGIHTRHICRDLVSVAEPPRATDCNPDLCARALSRALSDACVNVSQLGYLFGHTTSPHTLLPPNISWVADKLGYAGPYVELRQACTGFANALQLAAGLLSSSESAPIAIVGSETGSVCFDPTMLIKDHGQIVNLIQMGDGAGAVVIGPEDGSPGPKLSSLYFGALGVGYKPGFYLTMGGTGQPKHLSPVNTFEHDFAGVKKLGPKLLLAGLEAARHAGVDVDQVKWFIPHQANGRMGEYIGPLLGIPREKFYNDASEVGNLGSASIWVALHRLRVSGNLFPGDQVLVLGAEATKYLFGGFLYTHA